MTISHKGYIYIPIKMAERYNCYEKIHKLETELEESKRKKNILLEKINNLEIQNYLLKKKINKGE